MPAAISNDLKERIVKWYNVDQLTMKDISTTAECSIGLVSNVLCNHQQYGQVNNPYSHRAGHPSYLSEEDFTYLKAIITANPSIHLDEMQHKLATVRDVHVSVVTISRALVAIDLSRKLVTKTAAEQDEQLRYIWEGMMAEYPDPNVFIALDESAVDTR
jgi:transposase